jgi:hypothetical protein
MSSLVETPEYQAAARFVELTLEKRAIKERLKELETQLKTLEPALVGYLSAAGLPCFAVKNYLVAPHREPWVYPITGVSRPMVCEALKISGLGRMVSENYSTQSLTKYIKDLEEHHKLISGLQPGALEKLLPPALAHILNIKPAFSIRVQKKARAYAEEFEQEINQEEQETNDESAE